MAKGHCDEAFEPLRKLLSDNAASGEDLGACICVNLNGKKVVDLWDGFIDEEKTKEWEENTIVNVWSSSKTVTNMCVLIAHDRGLLDVNQPIAKYWPEFAENGKEDVKVRDILSHSTGVAGWDNGTVSIEDVCDPAKSTPQLAKQKPWWKPGTQSGYHALNQGHLAGELIRRVTGKNLKQFIAEEVAGPLGADFQLGAVEKDWPRISTLIAPPPLTSQIGSAAAGEDSIGIKALTNPGASVPFAFSPEWRGGEVGAANGHSNARALARILSIISLGGEVDGVKLLSPSTIDLIFKEQTNGMDLVLGKAIRFGIGYGLPLKETIPWMPEGKICFWGGWGGSLNIMDLDNKMTISYVMNKMNAGTLGNPRTVQYVECVYDCLNKLKAKSG